MTFGSAKLTSQDWEKHTIKTLKDKISILPYSIRDSKASETIPNASHHYHQLFMQLIKRRVNNKS